MLAPELRRMREAKEMVKTGLRLHCGSHDFIVVEAEPDESYLAKDTDYFVEGEPIKKFTKVHFVCLWDYETGSKRESTELFFRIRQSVLPQHARYWRGSRRNSAC